MTVTHAPNAADKFATQFIRKHAKALITDGVFRRSDIDDVVQELHTALIAEIPTFDPEKARWSTFVKVVIRREAISLRRRQSAQCRERASELISLNVEIADEDGQLVELGATVSEEEHRTGLSQGFISHAEQVDLAFDVQSVMDTLPEELREICKQLAFRSPIEVRRALGISRSTMQRRIAALRENFETAGVGTTV